MYWRKTGPDDCRHIQLGTKSYSVKYIISEAVRPWIRDAVGLLVTSTPRGRLILRLSLSGSARQIFGTLHDNLTASRQTSHFAARDFKCSKALATSNHDKMTVPRARLLDLMKVG